MDGGSGGHVILLERKRRRCVAIVADEASNGHQGMVRCALPGCEAYAWIPSSEEPGDVLLEFLAKHDCQGAYLPLRLAQCFTGVIRDETSD